MRNKWLTAFLTGSALLLMLLFPETTLSGTRKGLLLWYQHFLPAVFPFMILSGLLTGYLKKGGSFFAVICGFLNGYPTGAKTAAELKKKELLPKETACYYAVFCNMSGPMFMASYASLKQEMPVIYLTSIALLFLFCKTAGLKHPTDKKEEKKFTPSSQETGTGDYLMNCTAIMVKAGIYIMYFSILMEFLALPFFTSNTIKLLAPFLELTTGIARIQSSDFPLPGLSRYFRIFLCVSGGLCTAFQSKEVTYELNLSLPRYLFLKIIQAGTVCSVCFLLFQ